MKKKNLFLACFVTVFFLILNCTSTQSQQETGKASLFLWKLEQGNAVLYFFGSIHMGTDIIYPLDDRIYNAYNESDKLVVELNINDQDNLIEIQQLTMQKGMFTGGESIADYIDEKMLEKLNALAAEYNMPEHIAAKLKPWTFEITLASLEMRKLGYDPMLGLDMHFIFKAEEDKKPIIELESPEDQINLLSGIPLKDQVLSLKFTLVDLENLAVDFEELVNAWKTGNTEKFVTLTRQSFEAQPEFADIYKRLFINRNIQWVDKYEEMIAAGGKYFIVTGAGHLAGENSVVDLLRAKGYKVKQL